MVVALLTMSLNPISSPSSSSSSFLCRSLNPQTILQFPIVALPPHRWLSLIKFTATRSRQHNPHPLALVGLSLRPTSSSSSKHNVSLLLCNALTTSNTTTTTTTLLADTGIMLVALLQEIGIDERGTKLLLNNHPVLRLTPFEYVRARIQSLQSLGINGIVLSRLIMKRPDTLTAKQIDPLICFLRDRLEGKIEPLQIKRLLNSTEPSLLSGFEGKVWLLLHHGIPRVNLAYVLNKLNLTKALCLKSSEDIERTFTFLNRFGGVDLILRRPAILDYDLDSHLIPRIGFILELSGGDEEATSTVLRKLPTILAYTSEHLKDHVEFLKSFAGLSDEEVFRIILVYPNVFSASRKRKLHPRIGFLKQCGLSSSEIFKFLMRGPLYLSLSFEVNLAHKLGFLVKIGYQNNTKELALAMGAVTRCSCKNMQEVISLFLNYGLTPEDILAMSKKHPQVLQYNSASLDEKMDYLVEELGREVRELLSFPAFLGYNLDGRIKQRYEVKKKILGEGMSLNKLLSVSTESFSTKKKKKKRETPVNVLDNLSGG